MTPDQANDGNDRAEPVQAARLRGLTRSLVPFLHRRGVRTALLACAAILAITGTVVVAYELALARVPEHRAALERLIRVQTGLDVRFNELGLRWGWYGPEAVFRSVELGEPGRSNVLLRAPELIVGFDAWRTMQTGQLAAGRITLIAPNIDLERLSRDQPAAAPRVRGPGESAGAAALAARLRILERWRGGRIDLQGGTLKLPDPNGFADSIIVQVRRASLRHSAGEWSGFGLVYLPERLGRAARVVVQFKGDIAEPRTLSGGLRFEGMRLAFAGGREVLKDRPWLERSLPASGAGDITLQVTLKTGKVDKANGQIKASDVTFGTPPWLDPARDAQAAHGVLKLEYLAGEWRFASRPGGAQVQIEDLALSREDKSAPLPRVAIEIGTGHVHGAVECAPLRSAAAVARWLAPQLVPDGVDLEGAAENIDFDWNAARTEGERFAASARVVDGGVAAPGRFALRGLRARLSASESRVGIELEAPAAELELASFPEQPLESLKVASVLAITRAEAGWQLSTEHLGIDHESGRLTLSGTLTGVEGGDAPVLEAHVTIPHADLAKLHGALGAQLAQVLGPIASRVTAGRIEDASIDLDGDTSKGTLFVRDAKLAEDDVWPAAHAARARLEWSGSHVSATLDEGRAGPFDLAGVQAEWDADGARNAHFTGRAHARVEEALAWLREHPELQEQAPHLQDIVARGDALLDFDVAVPARSTHAVRSAPPQTRTRIAAMLDGVDLKLTNDLPPIESLRGTLTLDSGRLQRSTLSGTWLGSPLTLKVAERRDRRGSVIAVQAQGFVDARKLVALSELRDLPEVRGEAAWSGEFLYTAASAAQPVRWQGRADSNLIGVASDLPAPFGKLVQATLPLHIEISGTTDTTELRASLAERVRAAFALQQRGDTWQIDRGAVRVGGGAALLPLDNVIAVEGHLKRLDLPAYLMAWEQVARLAAAAPASVNVTADELAIGSRVHPNATVLANSAEGGTAMRVEAPSLGVLSGTLAARAPRVAFKNVQWTRESLSGEGDVQCAPGLTSCSVKFTLSTDSAARALADLGFRPDIAAAKGTLHGELAWAPREAGSWLETASGTVEMRFEDGIARSAVSVPGQPFALLTVPALLSAMASPAGPEALPADELRFKRLAAQFELRGGQATTSDLHFDGDAEILMRGRTGLLAHDYDYEAWVLRGEERIPASLRRLAATPRVAAAWMALRELLGRGGDDAEHSHLVLHLRGSWSEPAVSVE
ncbi:MAG TPA: AsmA-like C-terminal region-containing protein [Steroidobacteraceae bacterium]|nr:AsmA-like C-terminal region-containing protein [Steroidobacteraceae bacterium]